MSIPDRARVVVSSPYRRGSPEPGVDLIKNFNWTNEDQNTVSTYIAQDGMTPEDAADKWIADNQDMVDAWLG